MNSNPLHMNKYIWRSPEALTEALLTFLIWAQLHAHGWEARWFCQCFKLQLHYILLFVKVKSQIISHNCSLLITRKGGWREIGIFKLQ